MKKYHISITLNTDDDCAILYKGKQYCFYNEDLVINENFNSIDEIVDLILCQIKTVDGGKASVWTRKWLDDVVKGIRNGETSFRLDGNQKYVIFLYENVEEMSSTEPEYHI